MKRCALVLSLLVCTSCSASAGTSPDLSLGGAATGAAGNIDHSGAAAAGALAPANNAGAFADRANSAGESGVGGKASAASGGTVSTAGTHPAANGAGAGAGGNGGIGATVAMDAGVQASAGAGGAAGTAGSDAGALPSPDPRFLVAATGPCPEFSNGYVMFNPDGVQRRVLLYVSDKARTLDGPLIFSWHSTLPTPEDATVWLGQSEIDEIEAQGGIVAAPTTGYPNEVRPWDNTPMGAQNTDGDQRLMDEIVACAIKQVGIDIRRIHATGMSAGGLKTAQVSLRRSGYLASVVVYSGGLTDGDMPPDQDPTNAFAAMILYGGPTDISPVDGIDYTAASRAYRDFLREKGRFAFLCNHGGGHSVPSDSQPSAWRFMQDHPFGTSPSPYAKGLPAGFLSYCSLTL